MERIASVIKNVKFATAGPVSFQPSPVSGHSLCKPNCPVCHGIGFVRSSTEIGDPHFGKIFPCPESDPFNRYQHLLGLDWSEHNLSWESVVDMNDVMKGIQAVRTAIERGFGWVFLWGDYGLAKTLILKVALAEYVRSTKQPASFVRMAEIIDHLRGAFDAVHASEESVYRLGVWSELPLLCIDEFDRVRETEYATERRFVLMDRRYEQACRQKSITLMASNANPAQLEGYLADRIFDGRFSVVHLTGRSARPMMAV